MDKKSELEDFKTNLQEEQKDTNRDRILSGIVIYMFVTSIFFRTMPLIFEDWYQIWFFPYLNFVLGICWAFVPLLIARQLKNEKIRQTGMILGSIYMILTLGFTLKEAVSNFF